MSVLDLFYSTEESLLVHPPLFSNEIFLINTKYRLMPCRPFFSLFLNRSASNKNFFMVYYYMKKGDKEIRHINGKDIYLFLNTN